MLRLNNSCLMDWQLFLQELNRTTQNNARPMASIYLPSNTYCFFFNNNSHDFKYGISDRITLAHPVERMGVSRCNSGGVGEFGYYNTNGSIIDTNNVVSPEINLVIEPSQDCLVDETQVPSQSNARKRRKSKESLQRRNKKHRHARISSQKDGNSSTTSLSSSDADDEDNDDDNDDNNDNSTTDRNKNNKDDDDDENDTNNANTHKNVSNHSVLPAVDLDKINEYHNTLEEINRPYSLVPPILQTQQQFLQLQQKQQSQQPKRQRQRRKKRSSERSAAQTPTSAIIDLLPSQSNSTSAVESDSYSLLPRPYFNKPQTSFYRTTFASDSEFDVDGLRLELENPNETINSMRAESYA